ncbi:BZIP transcription factor [Musa troglodytarum]|uniref:BZIP transcription factor n=1 Tax=Musa troglodytarum TaxID=320322 RepID=A0A9E7L6P7_9LILI|nr:BZIP transcription factor [Musa troglodytarum]
MAEPSLVDPFDPSNPHPLFDPALSPCDLLPPPSDLPFGDDFDLDIDFDFSVDDFLRSTENHLSTPSDVPPDPSPGDGSGVFSSYSSPDHQCSDLSRNSTNSGPASPDSGNSSSASGVVGGEVKVDNEKSLKRKDGCFNSNPNANPRGGKLQRSEGVGNEEADRRKARLIRNRESAQLSRQRKKQYVDELEEKVRSMHSTINELNAKISYFMAENASLRQQLGGNGAAPVVYPPPGPMPSTHFPWVPGYAFRPQGSHVPLVPIPRLKPQQPAHAPRAKKSESKTKKVASVSLLGLMLIILVFGVLPGLNLRHQGTRDNVGAIKGGIVNEPRGMVLSVTGRGNDLTRTDDTGFWNGNTSLEKDRVTGERCQNGAVGPETNPKGRGSWRSTGSGGSVFTQNCSETLPALLYVPRNGKHVKIDGNLIIHSVLAGEKAMAQSKERKSSSEESKDTALAIAGDMMSALAVPKSEREADHSVADDAYANNLKSVSADGPLQQWFREGMAGPILSSGMCTEVFQFDISPTSSSSIIPAASIMRSEDTPSASPHQGRIRNRRILFPETVPLNRATTTNGTGFGKSPKSSNLDDAKPVSSVVVSVLADPKEAGNGDGEGMISWKSISRIFVVLLLDGVEYVTYSCVLPFKTPAPIL